MKNDLLKHIRMNWTKIGHVGVDSGQLMLCDPCYIDEHWKKNSELEIGHSTFKDKETGELWTCGMHTSKREGLQLFSHFEASVLDSTPNQLIADGRWEEVPKEDVSKEFSYNGCCQNTIHTPHKAGMMNFENGVTGAGVAFSSGYGDGCYEVYALINDEGRIVATTVIMASLGEDEDEDEYSGHTRLD